MTCQARGTVVCCLLLLAILNLKLFCLFRGREGDGLGPAGTLVTASEHSKPPSSLSVNPVMEEKVRSAPGVDSPCPVYRSGLSFSSCPSSKGYQVPVLGQPALAGQLGPPHGHSIPSMGKWLPHASRGFQQVDTGVRVKLFTAPRSSSLPPSGQPMRPNPVRSAGSRSGWEP